VLARVRARLGGLQPRGQQRGRGAALRRCRLHRGRCVLLASGGRLWEACGQMQVRVAAPACQHIATSMQDESTP